jgi:histidine triad (HIT) family protein
MEFMDSCVFCEIIRGKVEASVVFEDADCAAFMDIQPVNSGHMLVVPKIHAGCLSDLDEGVGARLFTVAMRLDKALRKSGLRCEGVNLFLADGEAAFQEIFHVHLHVIPRFVGDGFGLKFGPHYYERPTRSSLDEVAGKIRSKISTD